MTSQLDQLKSMTTVVADTGDLEAVKRFSPVDCTTNPSLVLAAMKDTATEALIEQELSEGRAQGLSATQVAARLTVALGVELTKIVPGRVSTEVDANLSFDTEASIKRAREIVAGYAERGVDKSRVLIKLASTWEGIRAAEALQAEGIDCNLTLLFCQAQAQACADAGVFLISPFVGRITDWYKKSLGVDHFEPSEDPGVVSVRTIYNHYKANGISTVVMGASFRSCDQIRALAGCDRLTIAPKLLDELAADTGDLSQVLNASEASSDLSNKALTEAEFRLALNADAMATEKLAEGIRNFDLDHQKLIGLIDARL